MKLKVYRAIVSNNVVSLPSLPLGDVSVVRIFRKGDLMGVQVIVDPDSYSLSGQDVTFDGHQDKQIVVCTYLES